MNSILNKELAPNKPDIVSEKFEDEYILVSLVNGNYYSLRGTAADVWSQIEDVCHAQTLMNFYKSHFNLNSDEVESLKSFLIDLIDQDLVKTSDAEQSVDSVVEIPTDSKFEIPIVEAYSDMQDLLLLDPIHDVDEETGWPTQPNAEESK